MSDDDFTPSLPYDGSSGWSGSDASRDRADADDTSGVTGKRQRFVMGLLRAAGPRGLTWLDIAETSPGLHHGQITGALSALHKDNRIARLSRDHNRDRCSVYVRLDYVGDRDTVPQGRRRGGESGATA